MKLLTIILALVTAALAAPSRSINIPRQETCCFTLADATTSSPIQQAPAGWLYLSHATHPTKSYCIDDLQQLRDPNNSACFIDPEGQVKCHDVSPSGDEWAIDGGRLVVNGKKGFLACQGIGGDAIWLEGKSGCRAFEIKPVDVEGTC